MTAVYDEMPTAALKRQHESQRFVGDLLHAEISLEAGALDQAPTDHRQAAARKRHRRLLVRDTAIKEALVRALAGGAFLTEQRNAVLIGGTGTEGAIWRLPLPATKSAPAAASSPPSISSTGWKPKLAPDSRAELPIISTAWTLSSKTTRRMQLHPPIDRDLKAVQLR